MDYYKIVDLNDNQEPRTLFHGVGGNRTLSFGEWVDAEQKMVRDGSSPTWYLSGFHVLKTVQECIDYLTKFKNVENKAIVRCS